MRLRCLVGRHDRIRVIDEARWLEFSTTGYRAEVVRQHQECRCCGKVLG